MFSLPPLLPAQHISQRHRVLRQLGGFSLVVVIVAVFVPTLCPVGGGGYIWKALEKGYSEHHGSACCTDGMFEIFVSFEWHVCFLLPLFVDRRLPCLHTNSRHALLLPLMHHKSLWCAKRLALGVQSGCGSLKQAGKPRLAGSQQPACTHKEHQILTTTEVTSFASQFWDRKAHPTKASQHEFLATCIDLDLEKNVKHAQWHKYTRKRGHQTTYFVPWSPVHCSIPCIVKCPAVWSKLWPLPPPPNPYISEMAFSHRFQKVYI